MPRRTEEEEIAWTHAQAARIKPQRIRVDVLKDLGPEMVDGSEISEMALGDTLKIDITHIPNSKLCFLRKDDDWVVTIQGDAAEVWCRFRDPSHGLHDSYLRVSRDPVAVSEVCRNMFGVLHIEVFPQDPGLEYLAYLNSTGDKCPPPHVVAMFEAMSR
jgi:hypothetical protein